MYILIFKESIILVNLIHFSKHNVFSEFWRINKRTLVLQWITR